MKEFIKVKHNRAVFFKKVKARDWNNWKWQVKNSITDIAGLKNIIAVNHKEEKEITQCLNKVKMTVTPYYASLIDPKSRQCPISMQVVPSIHEINDTQGYDDPLSEEMCSPFFGIVYKYPNRVLFLCTFACAVYCRHCTRRRFTGVRMKSVNKKQIERCISYIQGNQKIKDVLISGGDPFMLDDDKLEYIVKSIYAIKHVDIIRIGTRTPVVMPQRITSGLVKMLKKYQPVYVNTHFNHPKEITFEAKQACERLADSGIVLGNQTVLLKDINDDSDIMKELMQDLLMLRVRPYYLHQCDMAKGTFHFRTSFAKGLYIMERLRGRISGLAVPTYVVDTLQGFGKVPLLPDYFLSATEKEVTLRTYENREVKYPQHLP